jgi:Fe-S oxidoreductase
MPRRREYAFDSGESGQATAALPELARATALRRANEARSTGAELLVTECPQSLALLEEACAESGPGLTATSLTDLLATSLEGDLS